MSRTYSALLGFAFLLLGACATQQPKPEGRTGTGKGPAAAAPIKRPVTSVKPKKAPAENNRAAAAKEGALAAGEVGYFLDVLQGRLQQTLDPGVIVGRERDSIVLDFSRRLSFAAGGAQLEPVHRSLLAPLAAVLAEYRAALVSVRVSAEEDATAARKLAQERAEVLAHVLTQAGVAAARVVAVVPSAAARDGESRAEIVLAPETRQN